MNAINKGECHQKNVFVLKRNQRFSTELGKFFCELFWSVLLLCFVLSICMMQYLKCYSKIRDTK